jgi:hypothetical protein
MKIPRSSLGLEHRITASALTSWKFGNDAWCIRIGWGAELFRQPANVKEILVSKRNLRTPQCEVLAVVTRAVTSPNI